MRFASERLALKLWWQRTDQETQAGRGLSLLVALLVAIVAATIGLGLFFLAKFDQANGVISQILMLFDSLLFFSLGLLWGIGRIGRYAGGIWLLAPDSEQRSFGILQVILIALLATVIGSWPLYLGTQADLGISWVSTLLALKVIAATNLASTLFGVALALAIRQLFHNFLVRFILIGAALIITYQLLVTTSLPISSSVMGLLLSDNYQATLLLLVSAVCLAVSSFATALLLANRQAASQKPVGRYWFFRLGEATYNASYTPTACFFITSLLIQLRDRSLHYRILLVLLLAATIQLSVGQFTPGERTFAWVVAMIWTAVGFTISRAQGKIAGTISRRPLGQPIRTGQLFWGYWFGSAVSSLTLGGLLTFFVLPDTQFWSSDAAVLGLFGLIVHSFCFGIGFRAAQLLQSPSHRIAEEGIGILLLGTTALLAGILALFIHTASTWSTLLIVVAWVIGLTLTWLFGFKKVLPES
jgi:hypothetical protein